MTFTLYIFLSSITLLLMIQIVINTMITKQNEIIIKELSTVEIIKNHE